MRLIPLIFSAVCADWLTTDWQAKQPVALNSRQLGKYASRTKDDFRLILFVTADMHACAFCLELGTVYRAGLEILRKADELPLKDKDGRSVVWGVSDVVKDNALAEMLSLKEVPHLLVFNASSLQCTGKVCESSAVNITPRSGTLSTRIFAGILRDLGREDLVDNNFGSFSSRLASRYALPVALASILVLLVCLPRIVDWMKKRVWVNCVLSLLAFGFSTSGIIYNWQNDNWNTLAEGNYILKTARAQLFTEGLAMAGLNIVLSLCIYWLSAAVLIKRRSTATTALICCLALAALIGCFAMNSVLRYKIPFLRFNVFPPDNSYVTGSPRHDRHYTI